MNSVLRSRVAALLLPTLLVAGTLNGQWVQTGGPKALSSVNAIIEVANGAGGRNLVVGDYTGDILVSTDQGASWSITKWLGSSVFTFFASSGSTLFVGTLNSGVYSSTDGGVTWVSSNSGRPGSATGSVSTVVLQTGDSLAFASGPPDTLYVSKKSGTQWTAWSSSHAGLNTRNAVCNVVGAGPSLFAGTYTDGVFVSTDNGATWNQSSVGLTNAYVNDLAVLGTNIYAGTAGSGVFRSTNAGASWAPANTGLSNPNVLKIIAAGNNLFAGTDVGGVFMSTDQGDHWASWAIPAGLTSVEDLCVTSDSVLFAGTEADGVFHTALTARNWISASNGLNMLYVGIRGILVRGSNIYAGDPGGSGLYVSSDNGNTWTRRALNGTGEAIVYCTAANSTALFAGTTGGPCRSTDNGSTWLADTNGIGAVQVFTLAANDSIVVAGTLGYYVYVSTDNGATWAQKTSGLGGSTVYSLAIVGHPLFAGTTSGYFSSSDRGNTWVSCSNGLNNTVGRATFYDGSRLYAGTYGGVYISTNMGSSWQIDSLGIGTPSVRSIYGDGSNIFVGTLSTGVFQKTYGGTQWNSRNTGLTDLNVYSFALIGDTLFAGTLSSGVWKCPRSKLTPVQSALAQLPSTVTLQQNYPNPFNPTTTVRYGLPARSNVVLSVFNALGQRILTLVNATEDPGYHEVTFDGSNFASGVYFYRLQAGNFVQTRKLLLVR